MRLLLTILMCAVTAVAQVEVTTINATDQISASRAVINQNFSNLKVYADINLLTSDNSVNLSNDFVSVYRASLSAVRKVSLSNLGLINTASNQGTVGVGIFKQKTLLDLEFYKLNSANNKLSIALNGTDRIDFTINESNFTLSNIGGVLVIGQIPTGTTSSTVALGNHLHTGVYEPANTNIQIHISNTSNPHSVTKAQVGLGNVTNDAQVPLSQKAAADGVATLDGSSKVPIAQIPTGTTSTTVATGDRGVTNGNTHDHNGGDGGQVDYNNLANLPNLGLYAQLGAANSWTRGQTINGAQDEVQLKVKGAATQTQPIFQVLKNDNTVLAEIGPNGGPLAVDALEATATDTHPTCSAGKYYIYSDLSETKWKKCMNGVESDLDTTGSGVSLNVSGTASLGTSAISSGACASVVTVSATGVATTDAITWTPDADISGVTGYAPVTTGGLTIYPYPTANNVNFKVCNPTSSSITPGAVTLNWRVVR